eukprot:SAG11_NODE_17014_length_531_cov_0.643519_1_plen_103_part_00
MNTLLIWQEDYTNTMRRTSAEVGLIETIRTLNKGALTLCSLHSLCICTQVLYESLSGKSPSEISAEAARAGIPVDEWSAARAEEIAAERYHTTSAELIVRQV